MKTLSANAKYEMIPVADLKICNYQRSIEVVRAKKYAAEFDVNRVGVIIVSERNGFYYVIDGQHRTFAAKLAKVPALMCQVLQGLTYEEEARLFKEINTALKKPSIADIFKADVEAKETQALEITEILSNLGLKISKAIGNNTISAVGTINHIYKKYGSKHLNQTLELIKQTWNGVTDSLNNKVISGVSEFINTYQNEEYFDTAVFIRQLEKVEPVVLLREAKSDYSSTSAEIRMVNMLFKYYNMKLRKRLENKHYKV